MGYLRPKLSPLSQETYSPIKHEILNNFKPYFGDTFLIKKSVFCNNKMFFKYSVAGIDAVSF